MLDLEFDGVSGVLPQSDSFNVNGFTFGEPPWRSAKLHISDGAASSSGEVVIHHSFLWWLLWWCRRQVTGVGVKLKDVLLSFQFCHVGLYVTCTLFFYVMNEKRITLQKKEEDESVLPRFEF